MRRKKIKKGGEKSTDQHSANSGDDCPGIRVEVEHGTFELLDGSESGWVVGNRGYNMRLRGDFEGEPAH